MEPVFLAVVSLLFAFLLGAVSFAVLAGRMKGVDIRRHGSGNPGATNAIRVLGKPLGLAVFFLDFLKGCAPVLAARVLFQGRLDPPAVEFLAFACGGAAVLGHIYSPFLGFRGGKGVAAAAGLFLAVQWDAALLSFAVFFLVRALSRYVSLSSVALGIAFPLLLFLLHRERALGEMGGVLAGSIVLAVLITVRHRSNLVRIVRGEEPKVGERAPEGRRGR